ncbi:MAG: acyl-CoA dehydrogenase family protein [Thermoplasmata archaeon]|nr:acyl-CoA dehydrogenase family protein [Thermoplasmata archaeon]
MGPPGRSTNGWGERARAFAERELLPRAAQIDREDRMPVEVPRALAREGFLGLSLPKQYGGHDAGSLATASVLEELARGSAAAAVLVAVHLSVCGSPIAQWGDDRQKEELLRPLAEGRWIGAFALTEPDAGSDAKQLRTQYRSSVDGFRLTGSKTFITNGGLAELLLVFATRDPSLGSKGITAFALRKGTPGFSVTSRFDKLGLRGSETTELAFDDVALPKEARIGPEGSGLKVALGALTGGRIGIAACALGVAVAAYDELRRTAKLNPTDLTRSLVARSYSELAATRALVERAAARRDAGLPVEEEASAAKLLASQAAVHIANAALDAAGRAGVSSGSAAERLLRDARVFPIVEGTTEIQERILGRALLAD